LLPAMLLCRLSLTVLIILVVFVSSTICLGGFALATTRSKLD
jgi:hypothetical protein